MILFQRPRKEALRVVRRALHAHVFDSEEMYLHETLITPSILACKCGCIASVGEGKASVIWEPEPRKEIAC